MRAGELIVIRHGVTESPARLAGRTDVGLALIPEPISLAIDALRVSPALRARQTASGLFPEVAMHEDDRFWEQDFGTWDGVQYSELPDVGDLSREDLALATGEGGESFVAMVDRVRPALEEAAAAVLETGARVAIVAHAGTVRAALALAMGDVSGALAFQVTHLGATRIKCYPGGLAVTAVNEALV